MMTKFHYLFGCRMILALLVLCIVLPAGVFANSGDEMDTRKSKGLEPILGYISKAWDTLTRSLDDCHTVVDPKLLDNSVLFIPAEMAEPKQVEEMQQRCHLQVKALPEKITHPGQLAAHQFDQEGLLYLEHEYVVPGGRFNEMYGWDSYFIVRGLVRDGHVDLAKSMVENFFFEIEHYGTILNANRSYYLSRSQPPFLTSMILAVYEAEKAAGHEDKKWLDRAYAYAAKDWEMWASEPHLAGDTGLARYYDFGDMPAPESLKDETDHYRRVAAYFLTHPEQDRGYLVRKGSENSKDAVGRHYSVQICDAPTTTEKPSCDETEEVTLSRDFYRADRSMRESGFDVSFRFGPHGSATHHYAAVCLNSLLYKYEKDLEAISKLLGRAPDAEQWKARAEKRGANIQKYFWDAQRGMYFDYNTDSKSRSTYQYITTFYPMWAGIATNAQAAAVMKNIKVLERPGGLMMSPYESDGQWDAPYAWAPTQLLAIEGMRKYGFNSDADRISYNFLSMVAENFRHDGTIREKYNAVSRSSETTVKAGYNINVVGFGWTNSVFLVFLHDLPANMVEKLGAEQLNAAEQ